MNAGVLFGQALLWIFAVCGIAFVCWLLYFLFRAIKKYFRAIENNKPVVKKEEEKKKNINDYFCKHCGKKVHPKNKFCKHCGGKLK